MACLRRLDVDLWRKPHILVRDHHDVLAQPSCSPDDAPCRRAGAGCRSHSRTGPGAAAGNAAGADRPRQHAASCRSRRGRPGSGPRRQPGVAAAAADRDAAVLSAGAGARRQRALRGAVRLLPRPRRDGRRDRTRPDALGARRRRRPRRQDRRRSSTAGRPDKGMPAFTSATPTSPRIVAFIHDRR